MFIADVPVYFPKQFVIFSNIIWAVIINAGIIVIFGF